MSQPSKEEIYDEQIAPLMDQIIAVCKQYKIAMLANFATPSHDDDELVCTTALLTPDHYPNDSQIRAYHVIVRTHHTPAMVITTTREDGSRTVETVFG